MPKIKIDKTPSPAREHGYTDANFCVTYTASLIPQWQGEAATFAAWRDSVWLAAITIMDDCKQGHRPPPTPGELVAAVPVMVWP